VQSIGHATVVWAYKYFVPWSSERQKLIVGVVFSILWFPLAAMLVGAWTTWPVVWTGLSGYYATVRLIFGAYFNIALFVALALIGFGLFYLKQIRLNKYANIEVFVGLVSCYVTAERAPADLNLASATAFRVSTYLIASGLDNKAKAYLEESELLEQNELLE
jgi:hypothetical protein